MMASEQPCCNFCRSSDLRYRFSLCDHLTGKPGDFPLYQCAQCGLLCLHPRPTWEQLVEFYPNEYHAYQAQQGAPLWQAVRGVGWRRRARAVAQRQAGGTLLDVGCATGEFLAQMELSGQWQTFGVEPVAYAAQLARERTHAQIFEGFLQQAGYADGSFDVVSLWDVLEHTDDPAALLREIWRVLRPGGLLVTRLPDPDSPLARWFGPYWIAYDAPRHLYDIPRGVLRAHLQSLGFERIEITTLSSDHFTFFASLGAWLSHHPARVPFGALLGRAAQRVANSALARTLLSPLFWSLACLGQGSSPVYFARKPAL